MATRTWRAALGALAACWTLAPALAAPERDGAQADAVELPAGKRDDPWRLAPGGGADQARWRALMRGTLLHTRLDNATELILRVRRDKVMLYLSVQLSGRD